MTSEMFPSPGESTSSDFFSVAGFLNFYCRDTQILQKSWGHIKILGVRRVTWSRFHFEDSQMLVAALQNLVNRATWLPEFVRPPFMVSGYSAGSHMVPLDQFTNFHETL
jgi:hypothetical protein